MCQPGNFVIPKLPEEEPEEDQQGPSGSQPDKDKEPEGDDEEQEPMDQAKVNGDKKSMGKASSLDFAILDEREQTYTLHAASSLMDAFHDTSGSRFPCNVAAVTSTRRLMESSRRQKIESAVRVPILGTLPNDES